MKTLRLRLTLLPIFLLLFTLILPLDVSAKPGGGGTTNTPPVVLVNPLNIETNVNASVSDQISATDQETPTRLKYTLSVKPAHGTVALVSSTGAFTYTPALNYTGSDTFSVKVTDPSRLSATAKVNITISAPVREDFHYLALGDSIATGTIYPGKVIESYVHKFYKQLVALYPNRNVVLHDLPVDGYQTRDLYKNLGLDGSGGDPATLEAVELANVITISIGGNNLMQAAVDPGSWTGYDFFNPDFAKADIGLKDFNDQWSLIMAKLRGMNPTAQIIVNTLYNPYDSLIDSSLHNQVDTYLYGSKTVVIDGSTYNLTGMNSLTNALAPVYNYKVADVYTAFDAYATHMIDVVYLYAKFNILDPIEYLSRNPHPRPFGQDIITTLNRNQFVP